MKIYAPSFKRVDGVLTHKIIPECIYCVHEFEAQQYIDKGYNVEVLPNEIKGNIARVRNYVKKIGEEQGERVAIIDDDIKGFTYWQNQIQLRLAGDELMEHLESMFDLAESWGVTFFGVNPAIDKGSYREYTPFALKSYISGSFNGFINCDLWFDETIPLKEDYDMTLQVLNKYRKALRFNAYGLDKDDHGNKGGCADYRTIVKEKEQMYLFQRKWGSKIVRQDKASKQAYDLNPIIKAPIGGV